MHSLAPLRTKIRLARLQKVLMPLCVLLAMTACDESLTAPPGSTSGTDSDAPTADLTADPDAATDADTAGTDTATDTDTVGTDTVGTDTIATDTVATDTVATDTLATDTAATADADADATGEIADTAEDSAATDAGDAETDAGGGDDAADGDDAAGTDADNGKDAEDVPKDAGPPGIPCKVAAECADNDSCTNDACVKGFCKNTAIICAPDANPCTSAQCDQIKGCIQVNNSVLCNDKDPCTKVDQCVDGACVGVTLLDCNDNDTCTDDMCVKGVGCSNVLAAICNDGNSCTADSCTASSGCAHSDLAVYADCSDGNPCTLDDACALDGGKITCISGPLNNCDDSNVCTTDSCTSTGCSHVGNSGPCDDYDPCTGPDVCEGNYCVGGFLKVCADDGNPCTVDYCVSQKPDGVVNPPKADSDGCVHANFSAGCEDGSACTGGDGCVSGTCAGGTGNGCDDKNSCTLDACGGDGKSCVHTVSSGAGTCDDGDACSLGDTCDLSTGACVGTSKLGCADNDACTADNCDAKKGCVHPPLCDDSDPCTQDFCQAGTCTHKPLYLFTEDFANGNAQGWTMDAEWEIGPAKVGPVGNLPPGDPGSDHSMGSDNQIAGVVIGGTAKRETHGMRYLTSPEIDTTGMEYPSLEFWRWLDADMAPYMVNTVEIWDGLAWHPMWKSLDDELIADKAWVRIARDVSKYKNKNFRFRFGFSILNGDTVLAVGSWNIDDIKVAGSWTCIENPLP